ncbi:hypothetical protein [Novosphingobium sp. PhB55]|uniref:hypothetical protein n=1 Tax=Novosphingobium sp. PhB55 TaxID=2485106 RepID=UPI001416FD43|nr:hypothetical protein [Novosphingobium sp. PhB55]
MSAERQLFLPLIGVTFMLPPESGAITLLCLIGCRLWELGHSRQERPGTNPRLTI